LHFCKRNHNDWKYPMVVNPLICGPSLVEDGSPSSSMLKQLVFWPHLIMYLV
jgi:hypothetical protein